MKEAGFGGKIFFTGEWPDTVTRTHIVAFKEPLEDPGDFNAFNLAYVSNEIPFGTTEFSYSTLDSSLFPINGKLGPGTYAYLAVAQQTTENLTLNRADWFVAGVFFAAGSNTIPGVVSFSPGQYLESINIYCDFNNPPPQPPVPQP